MPAEADIAAVVDIVTAARECRRFVKGMDLEGFREDSKTSSAVILQLLIIGEASKRLSSDFRAARPDVPWSEMIRMRDRLIHHYRRTDLGQVWVTVQRDLPELLNALQPLASEPGDR